MMRAKSNEGMQVLDLDNKKDVIVDKIAEGINISTIEESIKNDDIQLVFPVCSKRCYNMVCKKNSTKGLCGQSDYAGAHS